MASFPFELVSPERIIFSGEVEQVVIPAVEGEMTLLARPRADDGRAEDGLPRRRWRQG